MANAPHTVIEPSMHKGALLLVVLCGLLIAAGTASKPVTDSRATLPAIVLGDDVSGAEMVEIRDYRGDAVLSGEFRSHVDILGNTEKDAALLDRHGRSVIGEIELEIPAATRQDRRPELEVDIIGLPARQRFTVVIDDRVVGAFITDDRGGVDLELQEGEVPEAGAHRADFPSDYVPQK
jgi:hypothetical protein